MEFLDPKKQKAHFIRLVIGYVLITIALILTTIILLYQAYGFGIKDGEVIQSGLIFMSSRPQPADIYVNGKLRSENTNTRLLMQAGQYNFVLKRDGYRDWKRAITIEGGAVARFDYPVLFPQKLTTKEFKKYDIHPGLSTQSPDRRWELVQTGDFNNFELFDLENPDKPATAVTLPASLFTLTGTSSWQLVEWANDNRHVLLQHLTTNDNLQSSEYILVDRENPPSSVNLTETLGTNPTRIELRNKKYDKYMLYDQAAHTLAMADLNNPKPQLLVDNVLAFKTYGDSEVLYVTTEGAAEGKVAVRLRDNDQTFAIRDVTPSDVYLLDLTKYSGNWYVAAGSSIESRTYVYKNPAQKLRDKPKNPLVPVQVLKATRPNYISFSDNARFIMVENGPQFALYDAETDKGYTYTLNLPMDAPQTHANWMDGHRMMYVSKGKLVVFEFDDANHEVLSSADPSYEPFFDPKYKVLYSFGEQTATATDPTQSLLNSTELLAPADR